MLSSKIIPIDYFKNYLLFLHFVMTNMNIRNFTTVFIQIEAPGAKTKFEGVVLFKKSKDQYIISTTHEYKLDYEPMSPGH